MSTQSSPATGTKPGRTLSIVGAVLGVLAIIVLPIILGPIGAILGFVGYNKGDKPFGLYVGIGAIVTTILGMVLGVVAVGSMR